ncbi:DUF348 domain-containing protein [Tessaracoccus sp. HDW20]|uniref:ubiquitin-like domain-containing protein n=1 Tax=Tessaracoccus coleopterorum TaxID=2714950 RepID=UPI0018D3F77F|nr:ubiquitin-like domain-containing protein [Tessaracoccus coleopterorum]NHB84792.1 DUF348 domain-containing protein [Tessaracoccus coleopterorum]
MSTPRRMADDASIRIDEVTELASPKRSAPRGRRPGVAVTGVAISLALLLGLGGVGVAAAHKSVTLEADGRLLSTGTFTGDVSELLAEQGIELGEHDEVSPALDARLADGSTVRIDRARAVDVVLDSEHTILWTTEDHAGAALAKAAGGRDMAMTVSRSQGRAEIDLPLAGRSASSTSTVPRPPRSRARRRCSRCSTIRTSASATPTN